MQFYYTLITVYYLIVDKLFMVLSIFVIIYFFVIIRESALTFLIRTRLKEFSYLTSKSRL